MPDTQPTIPAEAIEAARSAARIALAADYGDDEDRARADYASDQALAAALPHLTYVSPSAEGAYTEARRNWTWTRPMQDAFVAGATWASSSQSTIEQVREQTIRPLVRAICDEGPVPSYHRQVMARHRREWPTLWAAIDELLNGRVGPFTRAAALHFGGRHVR